MSSDHSLVTFAVFAYNQEKYIAEAVRGALSQTYSPLEILISDDCSTDRTFEVIQREIANYTGPHVIRLNRNASNMGLANHINHVMQLVRTQFVVAAAGDDISLPHRSEKMVAEYESSGRIAMSLYSNVKIMDEEGHVKRLYLEHAPDKDSHELARTIEPHSVIIGCSHAWDRRIFDIFGPLPDYIVFEDRALSFRSAFLGSIRYVDEPLILYRRHDTNVSEDPLSHPANKKEWYKSWLKDTQRDIDVLRCQLQDMATAERFFPERRAEILALKRDATRLLGQSNDKKTMLHGVPLHRGLRITCRAIRQGMTGRQIIQWLLTFYFPGLYLAFWKARSNVRRVTKRLKLTAGAK